MPSKTFDQMNSAECARVVNAVVRDGRSIRVPLDIDKLRAGLGLADTLVAIRQRQLAIAIERRDWCSIELQKAQLDAENARAEDET